MIATFVQEGNAIDYTPAIAVTAGAVVVVGDLVGVAKQAILADKLGSLSLVGVFEVPKQPGDGNEIALGAICYWDAANERAVLTDGGGTRKRMGHCARYAGDAEEIVRVRFSQ